MLAASIAISNAWFAKNSIASCELRVPIDSVAKYENEFDFTYWRNGEKGTLLRGNSKSQRLLKRYSGRSATWQAETLVYTEGKDPVRSKEEIIEQTSGFVDAEYFEFQTEITSDGANYKLTGPQMGKWMPKSVVAQGQTATKLLFAPATFEQKAKEFARTLELSSVPTFQGSPLVGKYEVLKITPFSVTVSSEAEGQYTVFSPAGKLNVVYKQYVVSTFRRQDGLLLAENSRARINTNVKGSDVEVDLLNKTRLVDFTLGEGKK